MSRRLPVALWIAGLCSTAGCSFLFVHGPPPNHEQLPFFDCSSSNVLPVLDAVYAAAIAVDAAAAGEGSQVVSPTSSSRSAALVFGGEAALIGASAIYGFSKTSECRKAQQAMVKRAATHPLLGPTLGPVPAPMPVLDPWTGRPINGPPPPPPAAPPAGR